MYISVNLRFIPANPLDVVDVNWFFDTCIVRVEAPPAFCPKTCPNEAFKKRGKSKPLCSKNLESSVAIIALINASDISSYFILVRISVPNLANCLPSLSYNMLASLVYNLSGSNLPADRAI